MQFEDNSILIIPPSMKQKILLEVNKLKKLINIKIYTLNEFISKYYFSYDEKTIYYVTKKYKVIPEIAKIYIENLYYLGDYILHEKINFLTNLLKDLQKKELLYYNDLFKEALRNKKIIFLNMAPTKYNLRLVKSLKEIATVITKEETSNKYLHQVMHYKTLEEEVVCTANKICYLIKQGIDINNIYIANLSEEHRLIVNKIFTIFKIPFLVNSSDYLYGTTIIHEFLENFDSDISKTLEILKKKVTNIEEEKIYNEIIKIVDRYYFVSDFNEVKDLIINDFKSTKIPVESVDNCVKEVSFLDYYFDSESYVFLFNFNQGCIPKIHKDEMYLNDNVMQMLNLNTSNELNTLDKERIINKIKNIKNLYISYIDKSLDTTFYPSSIIADLNMEIVDNSNNSFSHSHLFNKIELAKRMTEYKKYNTINKFLPVLYNNYSLTNYDNTYKQINKNNLYKYLNNKLNLSYTSLSNYYKCNFRYYLANILNLDIYEETFMQIIGDIFHEVLEKYFNSKNDFEVLYNNAINKIEYSYTKKDAFFLNKLKEELKFVIKTIEDQNNYSNLKDELYEEKVIINIKGNIKVIFSGKIDKVKYTKKDNKTIVAIIDYKTGNPELNINNVIYGLDMQLPIYIYLAEKSDKLQNIEVAGFYLQKILNNEIVSDNKHSYEDLKKEKLKLQGYSNSNYNIIGEFDSSYESSKLVKSLKVSKNGFYSYSKVLDTDKINKLIKIVEQNIIQGSENILEANFSINPKKIANINVSCKFCKFKNICYMNENNIVNLKEYKNLEFLGGDSNAEMD